MPGAPTSAVPELAVGWNRLPPTAGRPDGLANEAVVTWPMFFTAPLTVALTVPLAAMVRSLAPAGTVTRGWSSSPPGRPMRPLASTWRLPARV